MMFRGILILALLLSLPKEAEIRVRPLEWVRPVDEFVNGGYGYHASFYPNIGRYLATVDSAAVRRKIFQSK
jgi:hypothetical protein